MKTPKPAVDRVAIRDRIRASGLRVTMARMAVLEQLEQALSPMSHAELADRLVPDGLDRATVYRNLMDLTEAKLVSRSELGDHVWRFEAYRPGHGEHDATHPHFVCTECGQVTCLADVSVEISPAPGSKHSIIHTLSEVLLKGQCENCSH